MLRKKTCSKTFPQATTSLPTQKGLHLQASVVTLSFVHLAAVATVTATTVEFQLIH